MVIESMLTILGLTAAATGATAKIKALKQSYHALVGLAVFLSFVIAIGGTVWFLSELWKADHDKVHLQIKNNVLQETIHKKTKVTLQQQPQITMLRQRLDKIDQKLQELEPIIEASNRKIESIIEANNRKRELITGNNTSE